MSLMLFLLLGLAAGAFLAAAGALIWLTDKRRRK
jgi:uncharacterized protein involved in exopolysaccharide biosynthesis